MANRREAAHRAFPLPRRLVGVFGTVVEAFVLTMLNTRHDLLVCCCVATKLIGNEHARDVLAALQQLAEEFLGCRLVAPALHQDIQHVPVLVNGAPEVIPFPVNDLSFHAVDGHQ